MRRIRTESIFSEEAEDPKFGKRPSGNVTLKGDGVDLENSKDRTVTEADKSGNETNRVLSEMEQHLADTQAGNKQRLDVLVYTELKSAVTVEAPGANFAADKAITMINLLIKRLSASNEVKLEVEADAIKVIEANPGTDEAIATAKANAGLKATAATVEAPEVKHKATSIVEPLSTNTTVADKAVAGVKAIATRIHSMAVATANALASAGYNVSKTPYFDCKTTSL
jgi:hypothetical protein